MLKRLFLLVATLTFAGIFFATQSFADDNPSVAWTSTNNSTLTGVISLKATAAPATTGTATIQKWCLTINGEEATNGDASTFTTKDGGELYGYQLRFSSGCWSTGNYDLRKITLAYDTTKWENKAYTLVLKVADSSQRESTSASLTFTTANTNPSVAWTSTNNSTLTGVISLKATAAPATTGTATIQKWCLTINGEEATNGDASTFTTKDGGELYGYQLRFSSGCWSTGNYDLRKITLAYDTTKWENKAYTLVLKVADSSQRESTSASLTFTTANTNPSVAWTSTNNSTLTGVISLKATAAPATTGTATIQKWCLTINGEEATNGDASTFTTKDGGELYGYQLLFSSGCWSTGNYDLRKITLAYDTTKWENKAYTLVLKVADSSQRESTSASLTFTTANTNPSVAWTSTNNSTLTGVISLKATAAPATTGTATIQKWCLTINGEEATNGDASTFTTKDGGELYGYQLRFSSGCWSTGNYDLRKITLAYDTTKWENKAYTLVLKVADSSQRESTSASLTFTTANPGPQLVAANTSISSLGDPTLLFTATPKAGLAVGKWCVSSSVASLIYDLVFKDTDGKIMSASSVKKDGECWSTNSQTLEIQTSTESLKNTSFKISVTVFNIYGHQSNQVDAAIDLKDPGLKIVLPKDQKLILPSQLPTVKFDQQGGQRSASKITWFIDGKQVNSSGDFVETLEADKKSLPDGSHTVRINVTDTAGNLYQAEKVYQIEWPKMVLLLTDAKTIDPAEQSIEVVTSSNTGERSIVSITWKIDGKVVSSYSDQMLSVDYDTLPGGTRKITAIIKDNYDDIYQLDKTYVIKWSPTLKLVGLDGYFYYSPAAPKVTVKAYLGGSGWSGKHTATATYKNSSGKIVKQSFTISDGSGSVVLQTLNVTTGIRIDVASSATNNAAVVAGTIELRKKPPAPVYTNIYLSLPKIVIWPNSFTAKVRVTGKGYYSCRINFQSFYSDFGVSAGGTTTVNIQPTLGINMAQKVYGQCTGTGNAGTTYFDDWIILSLQR